MKTITLKVPDDVDVDEWVEENGLVLANGYYMDPKDTAEARAEEQRTMQALAELGEACAKTMGPFLERIGQERIGTLLIAQGVYHMVNAGASISAVYQTVATALDEAGAQLHEQYTAALMEQVNSEDGLTMVQEPEEATDARLQQAREFVSLCSKPGCGTSLASCWGCVYVRRHEADTQH